MDLPARFPVIATQVAAYSFEEALELLLTAPAAGRRLHVHFCTVHSVVEAADNEALRNVFNAPDSIASPDGMPLVWVGRLRDDASTASAGRM